MNRYIDAEILKNKILDDMAKAERDGKDLNGYTDALFHLKKIPTADVVEVVRCKDCVYYIEMEGFNYKGRKARHCVLQSAFRGENDYCSDGIRREK